MPKCYKCGNPTSDGFLLCDKCVLKPVRTEISYKCPRCGDVFLPLAHNIATSEVRPGKSENEYEVTGLICRGCGYDSRR